MNSRGESFYDNIYQPGIGMNYPHSMMNYPGSVNDHLYWSGAGSGFDRFGMPSHNTNVPFNYMFGQGDHGMLGKNVPFIGNGGLPGMKGFGQINQMGTNKPFGLPEPLLKDDKLHPAVQKQLYSFNNSNEKR